MAMRRPTGQDRRMVPAADARPKPKRRQAKAPLQPERSFQNQVLQYARLRGWRAYHTWASLHSAGGFPDLVLVRRPRVVFAELKREDRGPTRLQAEWLDDLQASKQEVYLWRPSNWPEIERVLQ